MMTNTRISPYSEYTRTRIRLSSPSIEEDPQLNPGRWWERRRENQSLNRL